MGRPTRRTLLRFGPPVAWMGVIAFLSTSLFGAQQTGSIFLSLLGALWPGASSAVLHGLHTVVRKMAHLTEYGILGALWLRAFAPRRVTAAATRPAALAVGLAAAYAGLDEGLLQALAPNREPAVLDVVIDAAGAALGVAALQGGGRLRRAACVTGIAAALVVAVGSLAAATLEWRLGLPAWDLLAATVGATAAAVGLHRLGRAWRAPP